MRRGAFGAAEPMTLRDVTAPALQDDVIVLERFSHLDVDAQVAGEDEEHARRFGWFPARSTRETVAAAIRDWNESWKTSGPSRTLAARCSASRTLIGGCELRLLDGGAAEMSYWILRAHRRHGHGTRVAKLAATYAFEALEVTHIDLAIEPDNIASLGIARNAGFVAIEGARVPLAPGAPPLEVVRLRRSRF